LKGHAHGHEAGHRNVSHQHSGRESLRICTVQYRKTTPVVEISQRPSPFIDQKVLARDTQIYHAKGLPRDPDSGGMSGRCPGVVRTFPIQQSVAPHTLIVLRLPDMDSNQRDLHTIRELSHRWHTASPPSAVRSPCCAGTGKKMKETKRTRFYTSRILCGSTLLPVRVRSPKTPVMLVMVR
jgi:hypothetical protein